MLNLVILVVVGAVAGVVCRQWRAVARRGKYNEMTKGIGR